MSTLFDSITPEQRPLADRLRPQSLAEVVGQDHLLGDGGSIQQMLDNGFLPSMILWGSAGCGKTTIARLLADAVGLEFESVSAIYSGVADLRKVFDRAKGRLASGQQTCLFVDEIHRFNKAQQDSFLPYVEEGTIILIGATTENPSFELNTALLSRTQVYTLNRLDETALEELVLRAEQLTEKPLPLNEDARGVLLGLTDGDGRYLLNIVEMLLSLSVDDDMTPEQLATVVQRRMPIFDKSSDSHYNLLSAFHKSVRGSDADAAVYWVARMLDGGEDPLTIARRMLCIAYEDVGLADPNAAVQANLAWDTYHRLGEAEGVRAIYQCALYLATAPKSNTVERTRHEAARLAKKYGSLMPPKNILNAPTAMMQDMGYHADYQYDHDSPDGFSGQNFFPEELLDKNGRPTIFEPIDRGFERDLQKRQQYWQNLREQRNKDKS